ncbi:MAG: hypothetical protein ACK47B_23705 [Armatimonadota bacterium]
MPEQRRLLSAFPQRRWCYVSYVSLRGRLDTPALWYHEHACLEDALTHGGRIRNLWSGETWVVRDCYGTILATRTAGDLEKRP